MSVQIINHPKQLGDIVRSEVDYDWCHIVKVNGVWSIDRWMFNDEFDSDTFRNHRREVIATPGYEDSRLKPTVREELV